MMLKDIAEGLGISAAMVSKLKKRGMPVTSVAAAEKWRRRHLEPARTKGLRAGTTRAAPPQAARFVPATAPGPVDPEAVVKSLALVRELGLLAMDAIERDTFETFALTLRQAMAQVPAFARPQVALPEQVWDALTACIPMEPAAAVGGRHAAGDDLPEEFMGVFWYQIALGDLADQHLVLGEGP